MRPDTVGKLAPPQPEPCECLEEEEAWDECQHCKKPPCQIKTRVDGCFRSRHEHERSRPENRADDPAETGMRANAPSQRVINPEVSLPRDHAKSLHLNDGEHEENWERDHSSKKKECDWLQKLSLCAQSHKRYNRSQRKVGCRGHDVKKQQPFGFMSDPHHIQRPQRMPQRHPPRPHQRPHTRLLLPRRTHTPLRQTLHNRLAALRTVPRLIETLNHIPAFLTQQGVFICPGMSAHGEVTLYAFTLINRVW